MTTTYEKIINIIRQWRIPVVKSKNWYYIACIFEKDWNIFTTDWYSDIKDIYIGNWYSRNKEEVEERKREIVAIHDRQRNEYRSWDLVDLDIEALEKTNDWGGFKDKYWDGKWLEICAVHNEKSWLYYRIHTKDKSNWNAFGYEYLLPHDTTITWKDKWLEEWIKNGYLEDGKIVK